MPEEEANIDSQKTLDDLLRELPVGKTPKGTIYATPVIPLKVGNESLIPGQIAEVRYNGETPLACCGGVQIPLSNQVPTQGHPSDPDNWKVVDVVEPNQPLLFDMYSKN